MSLHLTRRELLRLGGGALALGAVGGPGALLTGCQATRDRSDSAPYLTRVDGTGATVTAATQAPDRFVVRYGPNDAADLARTAEEAEATLLHRVRLEGLEPGRHYRYLVEGTGGRPLGGGTFRAAPGPGTPFTFQAVGDSGGTDESHGEVIDSLDARTMSLRGVNGVDENQEARVAACMAARPADLVIHTGDVVYPDGDWKDYPAGFFRPFGPVAANRPFFPTIGNHDAKAQRAQPYLDAFHTPVNGPDGEGRAYSFDWGDCHFTVLDVMTSDHATGSQQLAWAEEDLLSTRRRWRVVIFHVPPMSVSKHGDSENLFGSVVPLLERCKVDLVLNGHDHVYARYLPVRGVTWITTGGGGKSLYQVLPDDRLDYAESVYHHLEVDVDPQRLALRAVDAKGRVFDTATLAR